MKSLLIAFIPFIPLTLQFSNTMTGVLPRVCPSALLHEKCIMYCIARERRPDGYCDKNRHCHCIGNPGDWDADHTAKKIPENLCVNPTNQGNCVFYCQAIMDKTDGYCDEFPRKMCKCIR